MDQNEQLQNWKKKYEQTAIISCLAEDFDCVSYVDLVNQTVTDPRPSRTLNDCIDGWSETEN